MREFRRRAYIRRWAKYVRTRDDEERSHKQHTLIDSQIQTANEMAQRGDIDPVAFVEAQDRRRTNGSK